MTASARSRRASQARARRICLRPVEFEELELGQVEDEISAALADRAIQHELQLGRASQVDLAANGDARRSSDMDVDDGEVV